MFQLLKKYKKGVSPVIAIVLLIALTVAAAAVIWTLTSGILDDASGHTLFVSGTVSASVNGTGEELTFVVNLRANSETTLDGSKTTISDGPDGPYSGHTVVIASLTGTTLDSGTTEVTITFTDAAGTFNAGTYDINLSWAGEGDDPDLLPISGTA